jgi:magnesium transporter
MWQEISEQQIESFIRERRFGELKKVIPHHPEDIASFISIISSPSWRVFVFRMIPPDKAIDVFEYMHFDEQEKLLKSLSSNEIKDILNDMSFDDRTELLEDMPAELVKRCISLLSPAERQTALAVLNYPPESIGRLIIPDFIQLYEYMTAAEALEHIRRIGIKQETIYHCYVLDRQKTLKGVVSLKKIVLANPKTKIEELLFQDIIMVNAYMDREEAANIFKKYDLVVLPVVDNNNKLLGIVTFDDLVDVLEDEVTEDFEKIAAVLPVEKPYMDASVFSIVWKRSFWLVVLVLFESISAIVMQSHHHTIKQLAAITFFIPVLVAMGGNTGTQSATIIIRGLAVGDIKVKNFLRVVFRESFIGVLMGVTLALVGSAIVAFLGHDWQLSLAVGLSMGLTVILAGTIGASLPILFRRLKLDPALMSGPLIATFVDVVGILVYFKIALLILGI